MAARRIGAYLLPGDPVWLEASLSRYYDLLDDLVVLEPSDHLGWTGRRLPVAECLAIIERVDRRGIARRLRAIWRDKEDPLRGETAQRRAGAEALADRVDWILQIDNDEVLPDPGKLLALLDRADELGVDAVEWPMRVLFRSMGRGSYLEVRGPTGGPHHEYPGPIAVRPGVEYLSARRVRGGFLRPVVDDDDRSLQLINAPEPGEIRIPGLERDAAIVHNSWGRSPSQIHHKVRSWGHNQGWRTELYYWAIWRCAPVTWRLLRDFHPFMGPLWPRLACTDLSDEGIELVAPE